MDIVALFYDLDQFAVEFEPQWKRRLLEGSKVPHRTVPVKCVLAK